MREFGSAFVTKRNRRQMREEIRLVLGQSQFLLDLGKRKVLK
jgi:hypothetical protein